jgi:hypothetical protein
VTTRAASAAENRRAAYTRRLSEATTDRQRLHAVVWWWLAEIKRLPDHLRRVERQRLEADRLALSNGGTS